MGIAEALGGGADLKEAPTTSPSPEPIQGCGAKRLHTEDLVQPLAKLYLSLPFHLVALPDVKKKSPLLSASPHLATCPLSSEESSSAISTAPMMVLRDLQTLSHPGQASRQTPPQPPLLPEHSRHLGSISGPSLCSHTTAQRDCLRGVSTGMGGWGWM